ncbi:uncharacterized protein LOC105179443 [Olea europaea subsp. europaea]|uniref:Uncharacterized protein LOC105179443 n=1 Tax=Olea europaea subsp. europaea TaxID=158383 RepID=A0A8S0Q7B6_OLEEU|nr:uncharacterized protein LOC105179443 [Olea europaea subsp. europaea]
MDTSRQVIELESFQKQVAERFNDLAAVDSDELLSVAWIRKLLDAYLCCQEEFRLIVFKNKDFLNRNPMARYISEFFERSVKALDVCNATRDGIDKIRQWQVQLEIVLCALDNQRSLGEGQIRRAKKALIDLAIGMLDEKESNSILGRRNKSFGRNVMRENKSVGHARSLSWSVSPSWSAARQLQAIGNNLVAPRANEIMATNGLNVAVFTMNYVIFFTIWALVAAIPCQDRGLQSNFSMTRQFVWSTPVISLQERILEESRKRDRKNSCGLLKEIHEIEKCARHMNESMDSVHIPLNKLKEEEIKERIREIKQAYGALKDGLDPLERQVREVFCRIVRIRTDCLDSIGRTNSRD